MMYKIAFFLLLISGFVTYYWFSQEEIKSLNKQNTKLQVEVQSYREQVQHLQEQAELQASAFSDLQLENQNINAEIDRYLSIFRRHDLNKLAEAKPGLVENRINDATARVFEGIENETDIRSNTPADSRLLDSETGTADNN